MPSADDGSAAPFGDCLNALSNELKAETFDLLASECCDSGKARGRLIILSHSDEITKAVILGSIRKQQRLSDKSELSNNIRIH